MGRKNISQVKIADTVGKNKTTINKWIKYDRIPPADYAIKIADLLKVELRYFLTGEETGEDLISNNLQNSPKIKFLAESALQLPDYRIDDLLKFSKGWLEDMETSKESAG